MREDRLGDVGVVVDASRFGTVSNSVSGSGDRFGFLELPNQDIGSAAYLRPNTARRLSPRKPILTTCSKGIGALPESPGDQLRTTVRYPFGEEIDASLFPRTFAFGWERRHGSAANPANPVEDRGRMSLYVIITRQVKCLAHCLNISLPARGAGLNC
jgi:hypothetical protein